ncbi:M23 family metallopeptidase [Heyndrickxia camelliae]|uniref:M23 family peptidase n=1 Tax=Heyndrickxia camelliae TaxID=1707093 RepID=A0A2N3LDZ9_9BACI|nr:M23 family metallopeptidase [Heyndrickxia camelliae]PKR82872.1 M23 family peptidase [Heyndrickxia camelliae]
MSYKITSYFGSVESFRERGHSGIDFQMNDGTEIHSIRDGIVHLADYGNQNAGKTIFVEWDDGKTAIYGHLSQFSVRDGQTVHAGDLLGYSGHSGNVFSSSGGNGAHLHFGLKENGHFIDPSPYIEQIQHMNDHATQIATTKFSLMDMFQSHMNIFNDFLHNTSVHLINFITSTDYSPLVQLLKNVVELFFINI